MVNRISARRGGCLLALFLALAPCVALDGDFGNG
jgi:hypothetical protein